jgi:hypothetical protein
VFYIIVMLGFVIGNLIAVNILSPKFKNVGRLFYCALILFCTHIVLSLFLNSITDPFKIWLVIGLSFVAFYFEIKFLFDYTWLQAICATIIVCVVADIVILVMYYIWPLISNSLVTLPFGL